MDDYSVNQNGSSNYQASANGKKSRSKIIVNNNSRVGGEGPEISHAITKQLPGNSLAYRILSVSSGIASLAGLAIALFPLREGTTALVPLVTTWTTYAWLGAAVALALIARATWRICAMIANQLIALTPFNSGPAFVGRDAHLHRIILTGKCPVDGGDLRFRHGPQEVRPIRQENGSFKNVVTKRGPIATCKRDPEHVWNITRAVRL